MGRKGCHGRTYERVSFGSAASFDDEDRGGWVFICQAASEDRACEAASRDNVVVLGSGWCGHGRWRTAGRRDLIYIQSFVSIIPSDGMCVWLAWGGGKHQLKIGSLEMTNFSSAHIPKSTVSAGLGATIVYYPSRCGQIDKVLAERGSRSFLESAHHPVCVDFSVWGSFCFGVWPESALRPS